MGQVFGQAIIAHDTACYALRAHRFADAVAYASKAAELANVDSVAWGSAALLATSIGEVIFRAASAADMRHYMIHGHTASKKYGGCGPQKILDAAEFLAAYAADWKVGLATHPCGGMGHALWDMRRGSCAATRLKDVLSSASGVRSAVSAAPT